MLVLEAAKRVFCNWKTTDQQKAGGYDDDN